MSVEYEFQRLQNDFKAKNMDYQIVGENTIGFTIGKDNYAKGVISIAELNGVVHSKYSILCPNYNIIYNEQVSSYIALLCNDYNTDNTLQRYTFLKHDGTNTLQLVFQMVFMNPNDYWVVFTALWSLYATKEKINENLKLSLE